MEKITGNGKSQVALGGFIFWSRWLQAPLYLGLIITQVIIHLTFVVSALPMAYTDRITTSYAAAH